MERTAEDFAVAFNRNGQPMPRVPAQRYLHDPSAWLRQHRTDVTRVAVYAIESRSWSGRQLPVIVWREDAEELCSE